MPTRIQLQTRHGWRKPQGTVVVTATSKWANPWRLGPSTTRKSIVEAYRRWLLGHMGDNFLHERQLVMASLSELRGRDLACWCPLDEPCHADVLLEIANAPQVTELTLARYWRRRAFQLLTAVGSCAVDRILCG